MSMRSRRSQIGGLAIVVIWGGLCGCASYKTPGGGADMGPFADADIQEIMERQPAAPLPVNLATARVQDRHYSSYTYYGGQGDGRYCIVNIRDVEKQEDFDRIRAFPQVKAVVTLNRMLVSEKLESNRQVRQAAAAMHADMVLLYTFDTRFRDKNLLAPLSVITLGLSPNQVISMMATASALIIDVRTGYVYGACETTARGQQITSAWTRADAIDKARLQTERKAFEALLEDLAGLWEGIVEDREQALKN